MRINPVLEVVIAAIIWGTTGIFIKYLNLSPTSIAFFRAAIPTIVLGIYFIVKKQNIFHINFKYMLFASSLNALRIYLYYVGFTLTSIGNAVIILYTWPIFVTILSIIFLKERLSKRSIILLSLAFLGIIITYINKEISFDDKDFIGMTSVLISSAIYAITVIIYKKGSNKYSKLEIVFFQNVIGAIIFLPFIITAKPYPTLVQISVASIYAILIGLVAFGLFFSGLQKLKVSTASIITYIEVVSAIIFSIIIYQEIPTWNILVGGGFIIISTILMKK